MKVSDKKALELARQFIKDGLDPDNNTDMYEFGQDHDLSIAQVREIVLGDSDVPEPVEHPELAGLIDCCKSYIEEVKEHGECDSDTRHYIFEEAMQAIYGKNIFDWINKNQ